MARLVLALLFCVALGCSPGGRGRDAGPVGDGMIPPQPDHDGDGISDSDEGRSEGRDTDVDGVADYADDDSDADGIPDSVEAGDDNTNTPPEDVDNDGTPNFVDTDSDGNGILDAIEGTSDADGDGDEDFRDLDDDNDRVDDAAEVVDPAAPPDFDGTEGPDYRDPDSDADNILDGDERARTGDGVDTDEDMIPDWQDPDSDGDGWDDRDEAGDADIRTPPVDTDMDLVPDFRDPDSDNDGLSDADELAAGTARTNGDTDGDDVSDLIEVAAGTNPLERADSPRARGDFVFVVPYMMPSDPTRDTLNFETALQFADLYFNFDTTGSMSAELTAMRNPTTGVPGIIDQLRCAETTTPCVADGDCGAMQVCNRRGFCAEDPRTATEPCIPDIWTGVGHFDDVNTYRNIVSIQPDPAVTAAAIPGTGAGGEEAPHQAVGCIANPTLCGATPSCSTAAGGVGCPGFRAEAVRILVQITDADDQCGGCYTGTMAGMDLAAAGIAFIGLWGTGDDGGTGTPESIMREIGIAAGSVDGAGAPYVYPAIDAAVVPQTVAAVRALVNADNFRITIDAAELPDDDGDAVRFVDFLEVNVSGTGRCTMVSPTEDTPGPPDRPAPDRHDDAFPALRPGIPVCWDVVPITNTIQMPSSSPLVYKALLTVRANGSEVDTRTVYFLVPPVIEEPGGPD